MIANTCTCEEMQRKMKAFERKKKLTLTGRKLVSPVYLDRFCVT